jgi:hypothetical protein
MNICPFWKAYSRSDNRENAPSPHLWKPEIQNVVLKTRYWSLFLTKWTHSQFQMIYFEIQITWVGSISFPQIFLKICPSPGPCLEVRYMLVLLRKRTAGLHSTLMLQNIHLTSPTTEYSTYSQVYAIYYGTRMRHPQLVMYTFPPPQSYTILFSIYFRWEIQT